MSEFVDIIYSLKIILRPYLIIHNSLMHSKFVKFMIKINVRIQLKK